MRDSRQIRSALLRELFRNENPGKAAGPGPSPLSVRYEVSDVRELGDPWRNVVVAASPGRGDFVGSAAMRAAVDGEIEDPFANLRLHWRNPRVGLQLSIEQRQ